MEGIGGFSDDIGYLRGDLVTGWETYSGGFQVPIINIPRFSFPNFGFDTIPVGYRVLSQPLDAPVALAPPEIFPTVVVGPTVGSQGALDQQGYREATVAPVGMGLPSEVILPSTAPQATVYETPLPPIVVGGPVDVRRPSVEPVVEWIPGHADTDWDKVYDEYVVLNAPAVEVPTVDWGDILGRAVGGIFGGVLDPVGMGGAAQSFLTQQAAGVPNYAAVTAPSRKVTVDTVTGQVTSCRRRRRRKMLTEGDFNTLLRISTLPNTKLVQLALAKAIR